MASADDSSAIGSLVGRLVAAGRISAKVGAKLLELVAPPANPNLVSLYSSFRRGEIDADDLLAGLESLATARRPTRLAPASIESIVETVVREYGLDIDEQEVLVNAITNRDPAILDAIAEFEDAYNGASNAEEARAAMSALCAALVDVAVQHSSSGREPSAPVSKAARAAEEAEDADAAAPVYPVHQLIHLTDTLRAHGVISTDVALGVLSATQARDPRLAAALAAYALGSIPYRSLCVVAAGLGSAYAVAEAEEAAAERENAAAPQPVRAAAPPPPKPSTASASAPPAAAASLSPARPLSAATEATADAADLDGLGELHLELVDYLRKVGIITGDDATTLRHLFVARDPRIAAAYRTIRETGGIDATVSAIRDVVAEERAADAATPEFIVHAISSLATRGLLAESDAELLVRAFASSAPELQQQPLLDRVNEAMSLFQDDGDVRALVSALEVVAAELRFDEENGADSLRSGEAALLPPATHGSDPPATASHRSRLSILHERRAMLATLSHVLAAGMIAPAVAAAVTRLIHDGDALVAAAWRLYVANEDVEDFVDTLCRAGAAALERSGGDHDGPVVSDEADGTEGSAGVRGAQQQAASAPADVSITSSTGGSAATLSRGERDVLLRASQALRDVSRRVTQAEAAALMRAILASQNGAFEHADDEAAAPALRSIVQVYARSGDIDALFASLTHVARVLAA